MKRVLWRVSTRIGDGCLWAAAFFDVLSRYLRRCTWCGGLLYYDPPCWRGEEGQE